ncbi:peptidyl-prolyl cis-trans isomerase, partial [Striga asiatica]
TIKNFCAMCTGEKGIRISDKPLHHKSPPASQIVMELFVDVVPETVKYFRAMCTGEKGIRISDKPLHHNKGSSFHCVIPYFICQGGDFTVGKSIGSELIYGAKFTDENFVRKHTRTRVLLMANAGPRTNDAQLFIWRMKWLDGKHVIFGQVVEEYDVVKAMEKVGLGSGRTSRPV